METVHTLILETWQDIFKADTVVSSNSYPSMNSTISSHWSQLLQLIHSCLCHTQVDARFQGKFELTDLCDFQSKQALSTSF
jgi:hypothetical protein